MVDLTGGGYCGWTCASPATFNPFNDTGDSRLWVCDVLRYAHGVHGARMPMPPG